MRFGHETILPVGAVAEWHEGRCSATAPSLNDFPIHNHEVGTVLGRPYYNFRHADNITSVPNVVTLAFRPVLGL